MRMWWKTGAAVVALVVLVACGGGGGGRRALGRRDAWEVSGWIAVELAPPPGQLQQRGYTHDRPVSR